MINHVHLSKLILTISIDSYDINELSVRLSSKINHKPTKQLSEPKSQSNNFPILINVIVLLATRKQEY